MKPLTLKTRFEGVGGKICSQKQQVYRLGLL